MHSNTREEIKEVRAGDIAAAVGLKDVTTGDTMCDVSNVITLEKMEFPEPGVPWCINDINSMLIKLLMNKSSTC